MTCHYRFSFLFLFKKNAPKTVAPIFLLAIHLSVLISLPLRNKKWGTLFSLEEKITCFDNLLIFFSQRQQFVSSFGQQIKLT